MTDVVVVSGYAVRCPLGGYLWQVGHYLAGLRALGLDPYFYEDNAYYPECVDPITGCVTSDPAAGLRAAGEFFTRTGLGERWIFRDVLGGSCHGRSAAEVEEILSATRLLIALAPVNRLPRSVGRRRVFIDLDPVFTQIRAATHPPSRALLEEFDVHCTIGENIGRPGCEVPDAGFTWHATRQPIVLDWWTPDTAAGRAFTTIGRWDERRRDLAWEGQTYLWSKRPEWMKLIDLPVASGQEMVLATDVDKSPDDLERMQRAGWKFADPLAVSADPLVYRRFIQSSRGELTVAKDMIVRTRSGWFSDRSACYLAAGRPVITQDSGIGRNLPTGAGLLVFADRAQALDALERVASDHAWHCAAARRICEEHFAAERVLGGLLDLSGA